MYYVSLSCHNYFVLYSLGLSTLYRNMDHEFYKKWLPLMHPDHGSEPQGYLLVSCYIIGKDDRPPVHGINESVSEDFDIDNVTTHKLLILKYLLV